MYLLYSVLMVSWGLLLSPIFFYKAWRHKKYLSGLGQRLGRLPASLRADGRPTFWIHACSVGEILSVQPLVQLLHERFPEAGFVFSTITNTGQTLARERFARYGEGKTFFFPIDLATIAGRVLDWIQPRMAIIIDTEIWPNVLHQAHLRNIPVVLANGRVSAASFRYYRWARPALRRVFCNYRILLMRSEEDAARIRSMGAPEEKILVAGNIKYDHTPVASAAIETQARALNDTFGFDTLNAPLIVAGSTHEGEEEILIETLRSIRRTQGLEQTRLLLVPRHPERFDRVADLAARAGFAVKRRTSPGSPQSAPILLLDTVGELATAYRFATVVFVGGTLIRHGGQSILEPAACAKPIVVGPSMENFAQVIDEFRKYGGVRQISAAAGDRANQIRELSQVMIELLQSHPAREALGKAAYSVIESNRGAARRIVAIISEIYNATRC